MPNIVYSVAERVEMVRQREQGLSYRHIVDHFAATYPDRPIPSKSTVQKIVQRFHETGNLDPSLIKITQPKKQLTEEMKLNICLSVEEGAKKPLSQLAQEFQISKSSVHKIIQNHKNRRRPYKLKDPKRPPPSPSPSPSPSPFPSPSHSHSHSPSDENNEDQTISDRVSDLPSALHYSLWSYLKERLYSEGRSGELDVLWNRVTNVLESLDSRIIFKINNALDIGTPPEVKEEINSDGSTDEPS